MSIVFVGEAPARIDVPAFWPFSPGSGANLCRLLGIEPGDFWRRRRSGKIVTANVFDWPDPDWRDRDLVVNRSFVICSDYLTVGPGLEKWILIMLGRRVAQAFQDSRPYFEVRETGEGNRAVVVPHPSGRCRVWNDKKNVKKFRKCMAELGVI